MSKKTIGSKRDANRVLWSNDSPFKASIVQSKKRYRRKEKHTKKGLDGPFALYVLS